MEWLGVVWDVRVQPDECRRWDGLMAEDRHLGASSSQAAICSMRRSGVGTGWRWRDGTVGTGRKCSWSRRGSRDVLPRVKLDADSSTEGARVTQLPLCGSASGAVVPTRVPRTAGDIRCRVNAVFGGWIPCLQNL